MMRVRWCLTAAVLCWASAASAQSLLVEAESFNSPGGWSLDTQFINAMGSPYLLAHGLGQPVADATTTVTFPNAGTYHVFVRTKDWVARWKAKGQPGRFQLLVGGKPLKTTFGITGADWFWQDGGTVDIPAGSVAVALHDLTGFDGRCDAVYFTTDGKPPPNEQGILPNWRRQLLSLPDHPEVKSGYDLVVVGGGYAGVAAAISAARMGCKVALIQDRPVLGGNGSSEVRVWAQGEIRRGKYPRIGEIVEEFSDHAKSSPAPAEQFCDQKKEALVRAEPNLDLFLNHRVYKLSQTGQHITSVTALDTRTSHELEIVGRLFADCTGHGEVGALSGADFEMTPEGRMGMSNMWTWAEADHDVAFPETPWALDLNMKDFPYPREHHAEWFWEGGFNKDPLGDAEGIRDWNLRAAYGAFNAMKNRDGAEKHKNAILTWVAYIGGPRESRRLLGDVLLSEDDIVAKRDFPDGCVPSTWSIDLHYPKQEYAKKFPDNPFISIAKFNTAVDRAFGYPIPYRCFYSRNVDNLFMAGRDISVTHEALGTVRVMKTGGMEGEVVGKAASICVKEDCTPRKVFESYWAEMDGLLKLPGKARRATVRDTIITPIDALPEANSQGPLSGLDPAKLPGVVVDDRQAQRQGHWTETKNLKGYVGDGYLYAQPDSGATIRYELHAPAAGKYDVRISYQPHVNRAPHVPVTVETAAGKQTAHIDQREPPPSANGFISVGQVELKAKEAVTVVISTEGAGGTVHADAVQIVPVP